MQNLHKMKGITKETKEHIILKCKYDANFVVIMVCYEIEEIDTNTIME